MGHQGRKDDLAEGLVDAVAGDGGVAECVAECVAGGGEERRMHHWIYALANVFGLRRRT